MSPLLRAAQSGCIESVVWFMSDAPLRRYLSFAKSKAAREDARLKHLSQAPGGPERAIDKWLSSDSTPFFFLFLFLFLFLVLLLFSFLSFLLRLLQMSLSDR